jgi:hypothetical protein
MKKIRIVVVVCYSTCRSRAQVGIEVNCQHWQRECVPYVTIISVSFSRDVLAFHTSRKRTFLKSFHGTKSS